MSFKPLYNLNSKGNLQIWEIKVVDNKLIKEFGLTDGKKTIVEKIIHGKNKGKKNETSDHSQALLQAQSDYLKKIDSGYSETKEIKKSILPMLALNFQNRKHDIVYPCFIQPKLNGVRCLLINNRFYSRKGKEFYFLEGILDTLFTSHLPKNIILDGELYSHELTFSQIISAIKQKNQKPEYDLVSKINFIVFDCFDQTNLNIDFQDRIQLVSQIINKKFVIPTLNCRNEDCIDTYHKKYIKENYEGIIIRNKLGGYLLNKRSKNLQKLKFTIDDEFKIVSFSEGY